MLFFFFIFLWDFKRYQRLLWLRIHINEGFGFINLFHIVEEKHKLNWKKIKKKWSLRDAISGCWAVFVISMIECDCDGKGNYNYQSKKWRNIFAYMSIVIDKFSPFSKYISICWEFEIMNKIFSFSFFFERERRLWIRLRIRSSLLSTLSLVMLLRAFLILC